MRRLLLLACAVALHAGDTPRSWTAVADRLVATPVESYAFNWGEGVQMMGLVRLGALERNARYLDYAGQWARLYEPRNLRTLLDIGAESGDSARRGYCGHWSPAAAILYLYRERPAPGHLQLARAVAAFIRAGAERSPEGALGHWQGSHQLWVDTLYMACPLLSALGRLDHKPELVRDAADQLILFARHLQDERTGLFYHMWDWQAGTHSEGFWGRGDGWVLMSLAETLEVLDPKDRRFHDLERMAQSLARGLAAAQDADGLWHTVLDDPSSYPECSASAMFVYGLLKLARLHILPPAHRAVALRAWKAINDRYVRDGVVIGVSAGTGPQGAQSYRAISVGTQTWGTGAYLLAATEVRR